MGATRTDLIETARSYIGTKFGHQGRNRMSGLDCGGLVLVMGRELGLTELEVLGYADFPTDGKFEDLLHTHTKFIGEWAYPFEFTGKELQPGDLVSFDYGNGEGTRHSAIITGWDGRRYRIVEAQPSYGVCEHALAPPFVRQKTILKGWKILGVKKG